MADLSNRRAGMHLFTRGKRSENGFWNRLRMAITYLWSLGLPHTNGLSKPLKRPGRQSTGCSSRFWRWSKRSSTGLASSLLGEIFRKLTSLSSMSRKGYLRRHQIMSIAWLERWIRFSTSWKPILMLGIEFLPMLATKKLDLVPFIPTAGCLPPKSTGLLLRLVSIPYLL